MLTSHYHRTYLAVRERTQSLFVELNRFVLLPLHQVTLSQHLAHLSLCQVVPYTHTHTGEHRGLTCPMYIDSTDVTCVSESL